METLANRTPVLGTTLTLRRRGGRGLPVELSVSPLRGSEGKELGVIGVFRDLTRVRQLEERLLRSDRLAAVGELAAGLAHEIKNPLTSLLTFSRRLTRAFEDAEFRRKFQTVVPRELERINGRQEPSVGDEMRVRFQDAAHILEQLAARRAQGNSQGNRRMIRSAASEGRQLAMSADTLETGHHGDEAIGQGCRPRIWL